MSSKSVKDSLKTLFSFVLGLVILWALYRRTDMQELWDIIKSANFSIILLSLVFGLIGNTARGLRWNLFIRSLGYNPPTKSIVYATLGNYAVNFLLPRAGDVWRCAAVSKYDKIPIAKIVETFLVDKVIEILAAISIILLSMVLYLDFFITYFHSDPTFAQKIISLFSSPLPYLIMIGIISFVILMFTVFKNTHFIRKIKQFLVTVRRDLKLIAEMKQKKQVIFYTILSWFAFYLYFYVCFYAFDFTRGLGPLVGLIVFAMSNISFVVPVQGGIGAWHFVVITSLMLFGINESEASAFAGAVFAIQAVWTILYGVFGILALPNVKRQRDNVNTSIETETINQ